MSPDTVAIAVPTIGTGVAVVALIRPGLTEVQFHRDVADLRERMVQLEGLFEGSARREPAAPGTGTT